MLLSWVDPIRFDRSATIDEDISCRETLSYVYLGRYGYRRRPAATASSSRWHQPLWKGQRQRRDQHADTAAARRIQPPLPTLLLLQLLLLPVEHRPPDGRCCSLPLPARMSHDPPAPPVQQPATQCL